jgi:hypothetical protein
LQNHRFASSWYYNVTTRAAAINFMLFPSGKHHGHDPCVYRRDVLTRLPQMLPGASEENLLSPLSQFWKPA